MLGAGDMGLRTYIAVKYGFERDLTSTVTTANQERGRIFEAVGVGYLGIECREGSFF